MTDFKLFTCTVSKTICKSYPMGGILLLWRQSLLETSNLGSRIIKLFSLVETHVERMWYNMLSITCLQLGKQEDAEEFLSCILDGMHEEMSAAVNLNADPNHTGKITHYEVPCFQSSITVMNNLENKDFVGYNIWNGVISSIQ